MEATMARPHPSISATLALEPPELTEDEAVELSITAVLRASHPITICTHGTILNMKMAQIYRRPTRKIFTCVDLDTNLPLKLQRITCTWRMPIRYGIEDSDSQYFHTLQPEVPYKFSDSCTIQCRKLAAGHRYRLSMGEEDKVDCWQYGVKEDVLISPGEELSGKQWKISGEPITITNAGPIEFTVSPHWENIWLSIYSNIMGMTISTGTLQPPSVTASMSMETSNPAVHLKAELSVVIVSHALTPITIWIWSTVLRMNSVQDVWQEPGAFSLTHIDSGTMIQTHEIFRAKQFGMVHPKDRYFHTLQPEQSYRFAAPLAPHLLKEIELKPGVYRLALNDNIELKWWKEGSREEIVPPLGQKPAREMYTASGKPIVVTDIEPIEFTIPAITRTSGMLSDVLDV